MTELKTNDCHGMAVSTQIELFKRIQKAIEENKDHKHVFGVVMDLTKADYKNIHSAYQPPKLRPMSELPELNEDIHVLIEYEGKRFWTKGFICVGRVELQFIDQDCYMVHDFVSSKGVQALRWLPFRELPNPNDIKL